MEHFQAKLCLFNQTRKAGLFKKDMTEGVVWSYWEGEFLLGWTVAEWCYGPHSTH